MSESKFEEDMLIVQQHWNSFISLVKEDLKQLYDEQREINTTIKRVERVIRVLRNCQSNINYLLLHKESIIALDHSLEQDFTILSAFQKRNNLNNAVALRIFQKIINSEKLKDVIAQLDYLREISDKFGEKLDKVEDLVHGVSFDKDVILEYSQKYQLDSEVQTAVLLYPVFKASKKTVSSKEKIVSDSKPEESVDTSDIEVEEQPLNAAEEELEMPNNKEEFERQKAKYEEILNQNHMLFDQCYELLQSMTPVEKEYYNIYCSMTDEELRDQYLDGNYVEAMLKIAIIRLFKAKSDLDSLIQNIADNPYSSKEDIELLDLFIHDFQVLVERLQSLYKEDKDSEKEVTSLGRSKLFFLTDENMQPFASRVILENGYQTSLVNINQKVQEELTQTKKCSVTFPQKISKKFKDEIGKTVFRVRNRRIVVSYIRLNSHSELSENGVLILTVSLGKDHSIQDDTEKVIRDNKEQIFRQLEALERGDLEQIELQNRIRNELMGISEDEATVEGDEFNGRKAK